MKFQITILRKASAEESPYRQTIFYETEDEAATVAAALTQINEQASAGKLTDSEGRRVFPVSWDCSCLQKKCGACAMVINGRPALACDTFLRDFSRRGKITLEPLRKFPVVADLMVDRSILFENLKTLALWREQEVSIPGENRDTAYEASRCLQCGCCLEVCPNVCPGETFFGAAGFVPAARLLVSLPAGEREELRKQYLQHAYAGCGKSLACRDICPAGIDMDHLLSRSNAIAVWRRR